ncbi:putative efflux pump gsfJ [Cladobotryum mycophilum]|uniref:Efflux pump gsfJ n=1 Tax=Cladobotryum mycophilum TaxID=491253 RepID=A0ABR0SZ12_9HYPO
MSTLDIPNYSDRDTSATSTLAAESILGEKVSEFSLRRNYDEHEENARIITPLELQEAGADDGDDDDEYPTGVKLFCVVVALVLSMFLLSLDQTIVATAIPKITDEFHGLEKVGWYGSAYFMTVGGFQSTWGKIYKYFPLKFSFLISLLIFEVGSLICGVAPNNNTLIAGRAIAGVGAAGAAAGIYTIIAFAVPPVKRPAFTGIIGAAYGLASVIGPVLGGAFTDKLSWRWCFYINLPIGGVSAIIIMLFFKTPKKAVPEKATLTEKILQMDLGGVALIMGAVITYILALQYGGVSHAWNSSLVIGLLVGFGLIVIAWAVLQWYQGERSMIPPRLFTDRTNFVMCICIFFLAGGFFTVIYYLPIYFQSVFGVSPTMSGVRNLPFIIATTIGTIASGVVVTATGYYQPWLLGGGAISAIGCGLLYLLEVDTSMGKWIGYQVVVGLGLGASFQIPVIAVQGSAKPEDLSSVTGMLLFFQGLGGAFIAAASQSAFINQMIHHALKVVPAMYKPVLIVTGATDIRKAFPSDIQPQVIESYMAGLRVVFAIGIAGCGLTLIPALGMRWKRLKQEDLKNAGGVA